MTTHKLGLFAACRDLFDEIDPHAALMAETSCRRSVATGADLPAPRTRSPPASRRTTGFLAPDHFMKTGVEVHSMGAGGSTIG